MAGKNCLCFFFVIGCFILIVGIVGYCLMPILIQSLVRKQLVLKNGTNLYDQFVKPTVPIYLEVYVFHVVNSAEILNGGKPVIEEKGPYTYQEYHEKYDIGHTADNTVIYKQNRTFHFVREKSIGSDSDVYTTGNIPLMTLIYGVENIPEGLRRILSLYLKTVSKEDLFINRSVKEIAWGYHDKFLSQVKSLLPSRVNTDFVGVFTGMNDSYDGVYEVNDGILDSSKLGQIESFNGTDLLVYWKSFEANQINGTDGSIFRPFLNKDMHLPIFLSDICRSVYVEYLDTVAFRTDASVELWRFRGPLSIFQNGTTNPDNAGFCTPDPSHCLPSGLLNLATCKTVDRFQLPIVASQPHFLGADAEVVHSVDGLHPNTEKHTTYVHLEPTTGIMMEVYKRLQINLYLTQVPGFTQLDDIRTLFQPILWMNEVMVMDKDTFQLLKDQFFTPRFWGTIVLISLIGVGAVICLLLVFYVVWTRLRRPRGEALLPVNAEVEDEQ